MLNLAQLLFKVSVAFYFLSFLAILFSQGSKGTVRIFLVPALLANFAVLFLRYRAAWPMLPMYLGSVALPLFMGLFFELIFARDDAQRVRPVVLLMTLLLALTAVCFPKDYYIPFLKSATVWAHLFLLLGVVGKGCFFIGAAWAMVALQVVFFRPSLDPLNPVKNSGILSAGRKGGVSAMAPSFHWTVWGFAFWTLSMFSGEMWAYLGWGTPVVWDEPAITTTMATWFFYIGLLHLHLTGTWSVRARGGYAAAGALVVFVLNCIPDLGPFRWPF